MYLLSGKFSTPFSRRILDVGYRTDESYITIKYIFFHPDQGSKQVTLFLPSPVEVLVSLS